tara:strand:- start:182 stop:835 length:654 start_codon:yes stop_codon:yes gene_type:complete
MASEVKTNKLSPATGTTVTVSGLNVGSDAQGDVLYHDGTDYTRLAAGTSGHFLKTQGAGADPTWTAVTGYPSDAWIFRLTTGFNGSQDPVTNSLTKVQYLGTDTFADPSTGVFTFPSTGIWYIRAQSSFSNNASYYQSINIKVDTGSGQGVIATGYGATRDSNEPAGIAIITAFFDVTDTSTHKCSFSISANNGSMSTLGGGSSNLTYFEFIKVGAT